ncbi:hypothetical protein EGW08_009503 [Elysia chlorotica]|uniref:Uncharacterized protein n=1 Tax=Elysia chlorotica TaxID=188477 RepID=A0A3S1C4G1_ELYCH|nr:hypothetical protein EGW08_009503 [Elysia chlorotica]
MPDLDTDDLKALVHTELPSTRRRKTLVTEKSYAESGPYYRLTKAAAATFGWLYNSRDDYDVTQPLEEDEPDPQDDLRVWDLAETILHKDDVFAATPSEAAGSETSGGSRTSSQRTFSDRMRRMTCTYEPNTDLHTRMVVRRASSRRDTAYDSFSSRKSSFSGRRPSFTYHRPSLSTNRLAKPRAYVKPYAVASIVGLKDRPPSPFFADIESGHAYPDGRRDVEHGEDGGFVGPAAYDPISPEPLELGDKTQVMLLRRYDTGNDSSCCSVGNAPD